VVAGAGAFWPGGGEKRAKTLNPCGQGCRGQEIRPSAAKRHDGKNVGLRSGSTVLFTIRFGKIRASICRAAEKSAGQRTLLHDRSGAFANAFNYLAIALAQITTIDINAYHIY